MGGGHCESVARLPLRGGGRAQVRARLVQLRCGGAGGGLARDGQWRGERSKFAVHKEGADARGQPPRAALQAERGGRWGGGRAQGGAGEGEGGTEPLGAPQRDAEAPPEAGARPVKAGRFCHRHAHVYIPSGRRPRGPRRAAPPRKAAHSCSPLRPPPRSRGGLRGHSAGAPARHMGGPRPLAVCCVGPLCTKVPPFSALIVSGRLRP
mmetsp:Transcript_43699/g.121539  ORF Transcript_43699/g.121539 Transcript_43699/m.121539 type:complete len:208 (+) Transcript_43699:433-1056(+)